MSYDQHQHMQSHPHQQQHPQNMAPSYHHYPPVPSHHGPPQHVPHAQQQHQYSPPQQHHQQQYQHPGHPSAHPQNTLPPMPQYSTHQMPPQMQPQLPSQMPPPEMPGGAPPHQAQLVPEPTRSIEPVSRKDEGGRTYKLDVVQQPKRARMCGFGDKDRRPITPPPCVRLIIIDPDTGKEMDCNEIDHSMYVLNVDLWSEDGQREVNLVRHTNSAPSISSTTPCSYTNLTENATAFQHILPSSTPHREPPQFHSPNNMGYAPPNASPYPGAYGMPSNYPPSSQYPLSNGYGPAPPYGYSNGGIPEYGRTEYGQNQFQARNSIGGAGAPQGMYTRNLIGSLAASAFRLSDVAEHIGIWFILQDLSVRTEGSFRLRFSFVNVGPPTRAPSTNPSNPGAVTRSGKAPILACCYSEPFTVFSAKKFPGVCESTSLSKCFASQGIKIPIRKEGQDNKRGKDDDDDDY
ncbi:hypothetical protein VD0001_g904 [Verticillium dahliae]|nr:hypothetical protein VD0001_g904 [Verticillium dahliae]